MGPFAVYNPGEEYFPETVTTKKQQAAAKRNIKKAAGAARRKKTIAHLPKKTRTILGKEGAKSTGKKRRAK